MVSRLPASAPPQTTASVAVLSQPEMAMTAMGVKVPAMSMKMVAWSRRRSQALALADQWPR